jgi:hypothetical protein
MNMLEAILNAGNGDVVRQMANNFNLDERQARSAMGELVPALARGMRNNASSPQGLNDLLGALTRGQHQRYLEHPEALQDAATIEDGNGILGHVFGGKEVSREVASRAAARSGVDAGILKQMLPMLATLAMGTMAKNGLGGAGAAGQPAQGSSGGVGDLLGSFLDADRDGSVLDDLAGMAGKLFR